MAARKVAKKYTSGLSESTAAKRKAEIRKRATGKKKSFKPLPGDARAKTKPSTHTQKATRTGLRANILDEATKQKGKPKERFIKAAAKVTSIPSRIIRKVYERGEAAWAVGHRPGATQKQWAIARVYSFLTGGKTTKTGDADLFREVKKLKRSK